MSMLPSSNLVSETEKSTTTPGDLSHRHYYGIEVLHRSAAGDRLASARR